MKKKTNLAIETDLPSPLPMPIHFDVEEEKFMKKDAAISPLHPPPVVVLQPVADLPKQDSFESVSSSLLHTWNVKKPTKEELLQLQQQSLQPFLRQDSSIGINNNDPSIAYDFTITFKKVQGPGVIALAGMYPNAQCVIHYRRGSKPENEGWSHAVPLRYTVGPAHDTLEYFHICNVSTSGVLDSTTKTFRQRILEIALEVTNGTTRTTGTGSFRNQPQQAAAMREICRITIDLAKYMLDGERVSTSCWFPIIIGNSRQKCKMYVAITSVPEWLHHNEERELEHVDSTAAAMAARANMLTPSIPGIDVIEDDDESEGWNTVVVE